MGPIFSAVLLAAAQDGAPPRIPALGWEPRSDWVSVKDRGAAGDGRADDTAAIQAVLDAVRDGTAVYFPRGTYRVTRTLWLRGPLHGVLVVGHGRDTRLVWDGEPGGKLFADDGVAYSRFVGLEMEGRGRAAVGFHHASDRRFETEVRHRHMAFRDFTEAGILAEPKDKYALAETHFENCLFENCRRGVSFTQFNDYDYPFDGCEFRSCGIGVECVHGNFYVRNCRFEGSRETDIHAHAEHGCSARRCVSVGSNMFCRITGSVSVMTIQDCHVVGWRSQEGAVSAGGGPLVLFDCSFSGGPPGLPPVRIPRGGRRIVVSGNAAPGAQALLQPGTDARVFTIPGGRLKGAVPPAGLRFLKDVERVPTRVFDARRDFGARGDGRSDDTKAIQKAIDAARSHGRDAIAYLPSGAYCVGRTLLVAGRDYRFGGAGWSTKLVWKGPPGGTIVEVRDPENVIMEHLNVGSHDAGKMDNAVDILQTGTDRPSRMTYDGVFVYGMYQKDPFRKGLHLSGLGDKAVVTMPHVQGNIRVADSARAAIVAGCTYEGTVVIEGKDRRRGGLTGFLTRLGTVCTHGLIVRDSQSVVLSDFYIEQADNGYLFEGSPGDPPGRVTVQGAKVDFFDARKGEARQGTALDFRGYAGDVFFGHNQFYCNPPNVRIRHGGEGPANLFLLANCFYKTRLDVEKGPGLRVHLVANEPVAAGGEGIEDTASPETLAALARALDDLRRLGEADLRWNHGIETRR